MVVSRLEAARNSNDYGLEPALFCHLIRTLAWISFPLNFARKRHLCCRLTLTNLRELANKVTRRCLLWLVKNHLKEWKVGRFDLNFPMLSFLPRWSSHAGSWNLGLYLNGGVSWTSFHCLMLFGSPDRYPCHFADWSAARMRWSNSVFHFHWAHAARLAYYYSCLLQASLTEIKAREWPFNSKISPSKELRWSFGDQWACCLFQS